jgi:coenzyme F420-reducing hydrogenase gamma subunit
MGPVSILDPIEDIGKGLKKTFDGKEFNNKKVFKILDEYISGLSKIFGIPYSGPKRSIENTIKVLTEESDLSLKDKALKGIGFRMKEEKKKKKKKKKVKIAEPSYVD